jgi:galactose-1-phosphate uridylyltransferase
VAEFRRIPNLFEIVTYDYWRLNYGYVPDRHAWKRHDRYLASDQGREHVESVARIRALASGMSEGEWFGMSPERKADALMAFFAGTHDVIVGRRHYVDGATETNQLASSGTLTPEEHDQYIGFTVDALTSLYQSNRYARFVAVFQNWLRPAGASFDHLHKQLVAVDERSVHTEQELRRLRANLNLYNEYAVDYAARQNLVFAENEYAVAFAGFGHRYPSLEIYSKSQRSPGRGSRAGGGVRGVSRPAARLSRRDGCGQCPRNEEWHYQPPDVDLPMPWRIVLKWRVSTLAGFEGGTKIYLNTIDPWASARPGGASALRLARAGRDRAHHSANNRVRLSPQLAALQPHVGLGRRDMGLSRHQIVILTGHVIES